MPLWTPDDLVPADAPLVWMRSRDAVWNGSSILTSLANRGSVGGAFTVQGSVGQGTNNGIAGLRINAAGKYLDISLSGVGSSGTIFVFLVFKKLNADSSNEPGVLGSSTVSGTAGTVIWIEANDSGAGFIGKGYLQGPSATHGTHNATFPDTNLHCVGFTIGAAGDEIRKDGASLTISDTPGSVATYGTETWHLFKEWGGTTDGFLNSDAFELFIFEDKPSTDIIERLEGWSLWEHGAEAQLPTGHTYELAAPAAPASAQSIGPSGFSGTGAFGAPKLNLSVRPSGFAGAAAFGSPTLSLAQSTISPSGFSGSASFGTPRLNLNIRPSGFAGAAAFGESELRQQVWPAGFVGSASFGTPALVEPGVIQTITAAGFSGAASFGAPTFIIRGWDAAEPPTGLWVTAAEPADGWIAEAPLTGAWV